MGGMGMKSAVRMIRRWLLLPVLALAVFCLIPAMAEKNGEMGKTPVSLRAIRINQLNPADAETLGVGPDDRLPVFLAPFEDAAPAGGTVCAADSLEILAAVGEWRMVRYRSGTGWILVPGAEARRNDFPLDAAPLGVLRDTELTDDPWGSRRTAAALSAGESVTGLCRFVMNNDWNDELLYVHTELNGKTAWLFISREDVREIPMSSQEGDTLYIREGVTRVGDRFWGLEEEEFDDSGTDLRVTLRKMETTIDLREADIDWESVRRIVFPDSVTTIGDYILSAGHYSELRFPDGLKYLSSYAFYFATIDRIVIPAGCTVPVRSGFYNCIIGSIEAEEGNPVYSSKDGVLFSADGTVLLWYPDGKKDLHYDVPAGVEEIDGWAFKSENKANPLQSISLPMGLKKIGPYAFSGCGRLHSLTVPLTVTDLAEDAFCRCVSLERLSLPPGFSVRMDTNWTEYADFTWYNGDNGTTEAGSGR